MGDADKAQVLQALAASTACAGVPTQPDAADAVAVAVTHLTGERLRAAARHGGDAMISFLDGDVVEKSANRVVLLVGGVGYDVQVPTSMVARLPAAGTPRPGLHPHGRARRRHGAVRVRRPPTSASCSTC